MSYLVVKVQSDRQLAGSLLYFATFSTGKAIDNPRFFRKEEKALATAQRKKSKAQPRTKKIRKLARRVARIHERIKWRRNDFCHQHSRRVVRHFDLVAVEDLNVKGMVQNHKLAKSISDAAWTAFRSMLACKAAEAGKRYIAVNPAFTSQTCNNCGWRPPDKLTLSDRWFSCRNCGLSLDRDHNAALNILSLGLQALGQCTIEATRL
ncbi:MAG TPA: transposase [Chloroflexia bacterium]|nr:transposase [Chloroflexia bacterium]